MSSTVPYIGSKISLVSNSDIRYEGILYTINTQESTIALQSVRCCGTEGRKVPEIPPSSEIYDFIIFRGQDIKDLTVLESANPALSAQLNDPAIMSVNQRPAGAGGAKASGKGTSTTGGGGYGGGSSYSKGTGGGGGGGGSGGGGGGGGSYGKGTSSSGGYGSGKGWSSGGGGGWNKQDRGNDRSYGSYGGSGGRSSGGWNNNNNNNNDSYNSKGSGKQKSSSTDTTKGSKGGKTGSKGKEKSSGKSSDKGGKGSKGGKSTEKGSSGDKGGNSGRRGGGEGNSSAVAQVTGELVPSVNEAEKSKYHEDFDYEGENKKFEKAKMDVEGEEIEEKLKPLSGYDKGKSFFDNISCEATERAGDAERPKVDRNKARQNDRETFGDTRRPPRPTGGRRGKGGRRGAPRGYRN